MLRSRVLVLSVTFVSIVLVTTHWLALGAVLRFGVGFIFLVVVPGAAILEVLGLRSPALEHWALALTFGLLSTTIAYWVVAVADVRWAFPLVPAGAALLMATRWRWTSRREEQTMGTNPGELAAVAVVAVLAVAGVTLLPFLGHNLTRAADGSLAVARLPDATLHLAVANELRHSVPPDTPFLAGQPLAYHYGSDLTTAMFADWTGVATTDLVLRLLPALALGLLVLSAAALARRWTGSAFAGPLFALLVVFGEDLSYVPGLLHDDPAIWSSKFFPPPAMFAFYTINPNVTAMAMLFSALISLDRAISGKPGKWWLAFALSTIGLWGYKVFAGVLLLVALTLAAGWLWLRWGRTELARAAIVAAMAGVPSVWYVFIGTDTPSRLSVSLRPWTDVVTAARFSQLLRGGALRAVELATDGQQVSAKGVLLFALVAAPAFFVGTLGLRLVGLVTIIGSGASRALAGRALSADVRTCCVVLALVGPLLTLSTFIGVGGRDAINNSVWFFVTAKHVAWLFAIEVVVLLSQRSRPRAAVALATVVVVASIPSTIQFFASLRQSPVDRLSAQEANAIEATGAACRPGDVAITPPEFLNTLMSTTRCKTFGLDIFGPSFVSKEELAKRKADVRLFWSDWSAGTCPATIIERYGVRVVLTENMSHTSGRLCASHGFRVVDEPQNFAVLRSP